jgi:hypothetical protein
MAAPAEPETWSLPASLRCLQLHTPLDKDKLTSVLVLRQLQHLTFCVDFKEQHLLLRIAEQLPVLRCLGLEYIDLQEAVSTAPAWEQLPQLQELSLDCCTQGPYRQQMDALLRGVAAATQLTKLQLQAWVKVPRQYDNGEVQFFWNRAAVSPSLTGLSCLQDLCIAPRSHLAEGDLLELTVLTGLTRLVLAGVEVGDMAATALACNLQQLRDLDLQNCSLEGLVCVAAIAQLAELTELNLDDNKGLTQRSLMLLTGLRQLQQLHIAMNPNGADPVTPAVVDEFWRRVRQQQHLQ